MKSWPRKKHTGVFGLTEDETRDKMRVRTGRKAQTLEEEAMKTEEMVEGINNNADKVESKDVGAKLGERDKEIQTQLQ
ncbi:hypothetical protein WN48_03112 [Eufriesea mexicana]|nr:hypothetical protein WN48_03112 [Eufriesea mexicana]